MQIITGKYRARKLVAVKGETTRPTLARVKESVFNLIQGRVENSVVLDLFAGSGAFGAECISRGAKKVFFVDSAGFLYYNLGRLPILAAKNFYEVNCDV